MKPRKQGKRKNQYKNNTKVDGKLLLARILSVSLVIAFLSSVVFLWFKINDPKYFPIKSVRIYGDKSYVNKKSLQTIIEKEINNGFFGANIDTIRQGVLALTWVKDATVKRSWPDKIDVTIHEYKPFAIWNGNSVITKTGKKITPDDLNKLELSLELAGPENNIRIMLENYKLMQNIINKTEHQITKLELAKRGSWQLQLDDGLVVMIGREHQLERLKTFASAYSVIARRRSQTPRYVDLRYSNGFAVKWEKNN